MAYTVLDLQSSIQDDLKDSSFSATRILRYLNRGQSLIFNTHTLKQCEKSVTGALTQGTHTYEQQSDHQATIGGVLVDPDNSNSYTVLNEKNYLPSREFFATYPNAANDTQGMPTVWTEFGDQTYFNCPPDKAYIFTQRYYRFAPELEVSGDVPLLPVAFRELLEFYALYRSEKYRGNHDIAATYKKDFEDGLETMAMRFGPVTQVAMPTIGTGRVRTDG